MEEKYRKPSEKKWDKIIEELDKKSKWWGDAFYGKTLGDTHVVWTCGYCDYSANARKMDGFDKYTCEYCPLPKDGICHSNTRAGLFQDFVDAMDADNRGIAREIAVKIRDYIKNDKDEEPSCSNCANYKRNSAK
jgi:hypothetical protein